MHRQGIHLHKHFTTGTDNRQTHTVWCLISPLFVAELQNPLHILLGHWLIVFQGLKENRRHISFSRKDSFAYCMTNSNMRIISKRSQQAEENKHAAYTFLELCSKCFQGYKFLPAKRRQHSPSDSSLSFDESLSGTALSTSTILDIMLVIFVCAKSGVVAIENTNNNVKIFFIIKFLFCLFNGFIIVIELQYLG